MQLIIIKKFLQSCWKIQFKCKETEKMFDKLMDFMQKHGNDKEKIEDIFGEELSEKNV